jgi:hypothetical protein
MTGGTACAYASPCCSRLAYRCRARAWRPHAHGQQQACSHIGPTFDCRETQIHSVSDDPCVALAHTLPLRFLGHRTHPRSHFAQFLQLAQRCHVGRVCEPVHMSFNHVPHPHTPIDTSNGNLRRELRRFSWCGQGNTCPACVGI